MIKQDRILLAKMLAVALGLLFWAWADTGQAGNILGQNITISWPTGEPLGAPTIVVDTTVVLRVSGNGVLARVDTAVRYNPTGATAQPDSNKTDFKIVVPVTSTEFPSRYGMALAAYIYYRYEGDSTKYRMTGEINYGTMIVLTDTAITANQTVNVVNRDAPATSLIANGGFEADTTVAGTAPIGWTEVIDAGSNSRVGTHVNYGRTLQHSYAPFENDSVKTKSGEFRVSQKDYVYWGGWVDVGSSITDAGSPIAYLVRASDAAFLDTITVNSTNAHGYSEKYLADSAMTLYVQLYTKHGVGAGGATTYWDNWFANTLPIWAVDNVDSVRQVYIADSLAQTIAVDSVRKVYILDSLEQSVTATVNWTEGADTLEARQPGTWSAVGGSGSGPYADTIFVLTSGGAAMANVGVTAVDGAGTEVGRGVTDANGRTIFSELADTLYLYTWTFGYYQAAPLPDTNIVTAAGANDTVFMVTVSSVAPPVAGTTPVQFVFQDGQGNPMRNVQVLYDLVYTGKTVYHKDSSKVINMDTTFVARSDANGIATAYCVPNDSILVDNRRTGQTKWRFRAASPTQGAWLIGGPDGKNLNIPASATALLWPRDQALMGD